MKTQIAFWLLALASLSPSVHAFERGVVSAPGEVYMTYPVTGNGDLITYRVCAPHAILTGDLNESIIACGGETYTFERAHFRRLLGGALRYWFFEQENLLNVSPPASLLPITAAIAKSASSAPLTAAEVESYKIERQKIKDFIKAYGATLADQARLKKINDELLIEKTIDATLAEIDHPGIEMSLGGTPKEKTFSHLMLGRFLKRYLPLAANGNCREKATDKLPACDWLVNFYNSNSDWKIIYRDGKDVVWEEQRTKLLWPSVTFWKYRSKYDKEKPSKTACEDAMSALSAELQVSLGAEYKITSYTPGKADYERAIETGFFNFYPVYNYYPPNPFEWVHSKDTWSIFEIGAKTFTPVKDPTVKYETEPGYRCAFYREAK